MGFVSFMVSFFCPKVSNTIQYLLFSYKGSLLSVKISVCCVYVHIVKCLIHSISKTTLTFILRLSLKGATGLYKPIGGAGISFCIILNMLHIKTLFSKLRNTLIIHK